MLILAHLECAGAVAHALHKKLSDQQALTLGRNDGTALPIGGLVARYLLANCLIQAGGNLDRLSHRRRQVTVTQGGAGIVFVCDIKHADRALIGIGALVSVAPANLRSSLVHLIGCAAHKAGRVQRLLKYLGQYW